MKSVGKCKHHGPRRSRKRSVLESSPSEMKRKELGRLTVSGRGDCTDGRGTPTVNENMIDFLPRPGSHMVLNV